MSVSTFVILVLIGICAGILSGMIGIGGGIIMVPALVYFAGVDQYTAQGTSIAAMLLPIGTLAAYNYHQSNAVEWKYAMIIALTFFVGGYFGSKLTLAFISEATLKRVFGVIMLIGGIKLMFFSK